MGQERSLSRCQIQEPLHYALLCILAIMLFIFIGGLLWLIVVSPTPIEGYLVTIVGSSLLLIISLYQAFVNAVLWKISIEYYKFHKDFMIARTVLQEHLIAISYIRWKTSNRYWLNNAHKNNY